MSSIFGLDIGATSIGFAVIEHDPDRDSGRIPRLGARIFPEARDPKGVPLNRERRAARLRRRQLRRRRERRRRLAELLREGGLLPGRDSPEWREAMRLDPYDLRRRAFAGEALPPREVGRAIYHLAQRRHFRGRDLDEVSDDAGPEGGKEDADEKKAKSRRDETVEALKREGKTLGAWLAGRGPRERKRGEHATREVVSEEFEAVWAPRLPEAFREPVRAAIFHQRPTFWRLKTLGECRFAPGAELCPKGSWLSQQRRMLEKLNNLALEGGNARPLDPEERAAILARLQTQASMTWPGVRRALAPLYKARGEAGAERRLAFNLQAGGEKTLLGNPLEAKLAGVFGADWAAHPRKQAIRDATPEWLWAADYGKIGGERVAIRPGAERKAAREAAARRFVAAFGATEAQAAELAGLKLPAGWEPFSVEALRALLPRLEAGERFGTLLNGPEREGWRRETFPNMVSPNGEFFDRLPSPADKDEEDYQKTVRNPTVLRARNELRKVVNNLIEAHGKPDLIHVELAREVGLSAREREKRQAGMNERARERKRAAESLAEKPGFENPSRRDVDKWLLWEECGKRCPYTGDAISFEALFAEDRFQVEHIWPRSLSHDDSFRNKTLCRNDANQAKGNRTPYEYLGSDADAWAAFEERVRGMEGGRGRAGMSRGKVRRLLDRDGVPEDFASRQLNDTGYAAREAVAYLEKLWPEPGPNGPVKVRAVSGRVTGHLRRLWGLNNILSDTGEKTRADHRHHAIDALVVACAHPGTTQKLSRYWRERDERLVREPRLPPPWPAIRADAKRAVADIVVSHRVRKKVSGPLHRETVYGLARKSVSGADGRTDYGLYATRKKVESLSKADLADKNRELWPDAEVRKIVKDWVDRHGGDPKKAFVEGYPKRGRKGPEIRKVRLGMKQQPNLMTPVSTGHADLGENHHMAIYRLPNGKVDYETVSLLEASRRLARDEPVVRRDRGDGAQFVMSLSKGDALRLPRDGKIGVRIVESIWSAGPIVLVDHNDAIKTTVFRPGARSVVSSGGKKVSIDPIGRVRPAND